MPPRRSSADLLAEVGLVHGVEVHDDGTIGLTFEISLAGPPRGFKVEADAFVKDDVGADTGVQAAFFVQETFPEYAARVGPGRKDSAEAEHDVTLLGRGKLGEEQDGENGCENR